MENVQSVTTQCYTVVDWVTCLQLTLLCTLGHSESSVISYDFQIKLLTWPVMFSYQSGLCVVGCFLAVAGSITTQIQVRGRAFSVIWHHIRRTLCSTQPVQGSGEIDGWAHSFWFLNTSSPISIKKNLRCIFILSQILSHVPLSDCLLLLQQRTVYVWACYVLCDFIPTHPMLIYSYTLALKMIFQ